MSKLDIDNLTGAESLDDLEALLEAKLNNDGAEQGTVADKKDVEAASSADEAAAKDPQANGTNGDDIPEKVVMAKNGQHTIPYEVLEQKRLEAAALREQAAKQEADLAAATAERQKLQALLEKHGIDPNVDSDRISIEEVEQLSQDYPDIGKVLAGIARRLEKIEAPGSSAAAPENTSSVHQNVRAAIQAVPDLVTWRDSGDADRMEFAISIDEKLKLDPAWQNKPLVERFSEAAKRTKLAFGDPVEQSPSAKDDEPTKDHIPSSPSDLGQSHQAPESGVGRYAAMSQSELMSAMDGMTEAQIEALLAEMDT